MSTHYYPDCLARYDSDGSDFVERGSCGTWLGETSELSGDWGRVDCKRCLKDRTSITDNTEAEGRAIVEQMGDMAAYFNRATAAAEEGGQDE